MTIDASSREAVETRAALPDPANELLDAMPLCIERVDLQGLVTFRNRTAQARWAASSGPPIRWLREWSEESRPLLRDALHRAQTGAPSTLVASRLAMGTLLRQEVTLTPLLHPRLAREVLVVAVDTPGRRSAGSPEDATQSEVIDLLACQLAVDARQLLSLRQRLAHAEKLKLFGHFVSEIVHDLNNVFHVLTSALELSKRSPATPERWSDLGARSVARGTDLLRRLLDFARRQDDAPEPLDLPPLVDSWRPMLASLLNQANSLELRVDPETWPVGVAPGALESVLLNLVANARDAMPEGGICLVEVSNCSGAALPPPLQGDYVCVAVRDTGTGMPAHILARAGAAFNTTKRNGTGLGLASAYDLAQAAAGCVKIQSEPGIGTRVALYLQRAGIRRAQGGPAAPANQDHLHGNATVLVAHSDELTRAAITAALRDLRYVVFDAANLALAAALLTTPVAFNLIIAERQLHTDHPHRLEEIIRSHRAQVPVIFVDASSADRSTSADLVLRQPIFMPLLHRAVLEKLNRLPATRLSSEALAAADRLRDRLRNPYVRDVFDAWQDISRAHGRIPTLEEALRHRRKLAAIGYVIEVSNHSGAVTFKVLEFGSDLARRLGRDLTGSTLSLVDEPVLGSLSLAWNRCLTGAPHFDYARFRLGSAAAEGYERLILPASADGETVTHLIGVTAFEGPAA